MKTKQLKCNFNNIDSVYYFYPLYSSISSPPESDPLRLQQRLDELVRRVEEEQRARQDAERRAEDAELSTEHERRRNQLTTLPGFLEGCHRHLHEALSVETNKALTSKGFTNPSKKYYPKLLKRWEDFPQLQQEHFDKAYSYLHPVDQSGPQIFSPTISLEDIGRRLGRRKLASEQDLQHYARVAVEDMVTDILNHSGHIEQAQEGLQLGEGLVFDNHSNSLSDTNPEVLERLSLRTPQTSPQSSRSASSSSTVSSIVSPEPSRMYADQFCVYKDADGKRQLLFVVEYKPPHKLSIGNLRAGFRDMKIREEVIDPITTQVETTAKLQYNADKLAAAVATQTFHYMIQNGLEYSYITTGEHLYYCISKPAIQ